MSIPKTKRIRVLFAFISGKDGDILSHGEAALKGMTGNTAYPTPPVDLTALKTALDSYSIAIGDALDGGRKAINARVIQRQAVVKMLRLLAHYVESACNDDMTTFLTSGFEPLTVTRVPPQQPGPATISTIDYGKSGEVLVWITRDPKAISYQLRYTALGAGSTPGTWVSQLIAKVRKPVSCTGLTPGTIYAFQVCTLGPLGLTDWSDSVTKMAT